MIRSDVSVRFAEQIEIIYGPGSTLYGQDAISAVINIKTRQPGRRHRRGDGRLRLDHDSKEGYASFARTFASSSDLPVSVTAYVADRDSDLSQLPQDYPEWWAKYNTLPGRHRTAAGAARCAGDLGLNVFARVESQQTSLQAWFRESERSSSEGSGEGRHHPGAVLRPRGALARPLARGRGPARAQLHRRTSPCTPP